MHKIIYKTFYFLLFSIFILYFYSYLSSSGILNDRFRIEKSQAQDCTSSYCQCGCSVETSPGVWEAPCCFNTSLPPSGCEDVCPAPPPSGCTVTGCDTSNCETCNTSTGACEYACSGGAYCDGGGSCTLPNCTDPSVGGYCSSGCGSDTNLGNTYPDCGGQSCCYHTPTCAESGGTCRTACDVGEVGKVTTGCAWNETCCLPTTLTINVSVFYDLNRSRIKDAGETGVEAVPVSVNQFRTSTKLYTGTTDLNGRFRFTGIPQNMYSVVITPPAGYEVVGGTNSQDVNGFVTSVNVNFPIAPIGRSIGDFITVVADGGTSAQALGTYGMSGLRTNELGDNYYNAVKITQNINVADQTNRDKVKLIGIAFVDSSGTIPITLNNLKTKAGSGGGFIIVYARDYINNSSLGGPALGLANCFSYNFCKYYYYLYFNNTWYGVNAFSSFYSPYPTASLDQTTTGMKVNVSGNNNSIPTTYPGIISIPFTTYMYKIMGSKTFATYGFMYDSDGIQYVRRQKACDGIGKCTLQ